MQKHVNLVDLVESLPTSIVFTCKIWLRCSRGGAFGNWEFDGNLGIWTGENSNSQIPVGIGNANCGASVRARAEAEECGYTLEAYYNRDVLRVGWHEDFRVFSS